MVNVITKSGSNNFHGNAFEFLRNSVFNARNYFAPSTFSQNGVLTPTKDNGRDQIKRNQFGGTFGRPIIRNRTFFFFGAQFTRFRNVGSPSNSTVPSTALTTIPSSGPVSSSCPTCDIETYLNSGGPGGTPGTIDPVSLGRACTNYEQGSDVSQAGQRKLQGVSGRVDHSFTQTTGSRSATATTSFIGTRFSTP